MNNQNIDNLFSILLEALACGDSKVYMAEVLDLTHQAQGVFKDEVLKSLPDLTPKERALAVQGETKDKIQAIKSFRDRTNCSLVDAKHKVDTAYDAHKEKRSDGRRSLRPQ